MIHVPGGSAEFFIYKTRILYGQSGKFRYVD